MVKCEICGREFKGFLSHLSKHNISSEEYYVKYINPSSEFITCKCCDNKPKFKNMNKGYNTYCSQRCRNLDPEFQEQLKQTFLNKYGVVNPSQIDGMTEKIKQTYLTKYGVDHISKSKEFKEKVRKTCLERYGVENYSQTDEYKEKFKETCLDRYGVENPSQMNDFQKKVKQTCLDKYGTEHSSQSEEVKEKYKETCLDRYGVEHISQSKEFKQKFERTCLERYGKPLFLHSERYNEIIFEKYGVDYLHQSEEIKNKVKQTNLDTYGVEDPNQLDKIKEKIKIAQDEKFITKFKEYLNEFNLKLSDEYYINSKYKHNWKCTVCNTIFTQLFNVIQQGFTCPTCNPRIEFINGNLTSKPQLELFDLVQTLFKDAKINDPQLSYSIDITIPSYKIAIEYDGSYWHEGREEQDKIRQERLEELGWKFIRYVDRVPEKNELLESIKSLIIN